MKFKVNLEGSDRRRHWLAIKKVSNYPKEPSKAVQRARKSSYRPFGYDEYELEILATDPHSHRSGVFRAARKKRLEAVRYYMNIHGYSWKTAVKVAADERVSQTIWDLISDT